MCAVFKLRMPARQPTYYRWAEDKPCTTNQTYGYELRNGDGRNAGSSTCRLCMAEAAAAAATAAAAAKRQAERQQRKMAGNRRDGVVRRYSEEVQCKPINKGYTVGHVPITKRLQAVSSGGRAGRQRGAGGTASSCELNHQQSGGKDLYLWHALSGTIVHCKNEEECDE